ncbi:T9SS type A sorting domain-containing protein [Winogradskyella thalassocola]|uniref:Por secretion system C-terminal sorting domain-containing protein n=1 Tax=Winogradskyella thalassocola TaxID=262004 RepID=A0A1G8DUX1_9FLAO|nr:T9SS type A sorting domain-containing protein [Winogradskyella thalassocola]SDH61506.1 Por secretion system C-terminal sorting domain-containing protein [Winogradskyella thalassocola]
MKKNDIKKLMMLLMLVAFQANAQVDVTLKVDMSAETVGADGVHVVGTINGWSTDATMLTQEGATGIYSATIQLNEGWHRYKFLNGNAWGTEEAASYPCAPSNGDRFLYINNSGMPLILETVPFNGCNPSGTGFEVTFNVDMASEGTIPTGNVHMAGWFTDWNPEVLNFPNANGDIHSGTLRFPTPANYPIEFEYKYLSAAGWGNEETPGPEASCPSVTGANRLITVNTSGENIYDVFNACTYALSTEDVMANTFTTTYNKATRQVKMSSIASQAEVATLSVYDLNGKSVQTNNNLNTLNEITVDFQNQTNGIYFIRIESGAKQWVKKIIVY